MKERNLGKDSRSRPPGAQQAIRAAVLGQESRHSRVFEVELNDKLMNTSVTCGSGGHGIKTHHKQTVIGHNEDISIIIIA